MQTNAEIAEFYNNGAAIITRGWVDDESGVFVHSGELVAVEDIPADMPRLTFHDDDLDVDYDEDHDPYIQRIAAEIRDRSDLYIVDQEVYRDI